METLKHQLQRLNLLNKDPNVAVCDATTVDSCNKLVTQIKIAIN